MCCVYGLKGIEAMPWAFSWRITTFHCAVYHGYAYYPSEVGKAPGDKGGRPAVNNKNRERLHAWRSGRFVPEVFMPGGFLIVSPRLADKLKKIPGMELVDVVFEHLVDVGMPRIGDGSWSGSPLQLRFPEPTDWFRTLPHVREFEPRVAGYQQVLAADLFELEERYPDARRYDVRFGSYPDSGVPIRDLLSQKVFQDYPVIFSGPLFMREEVFKIIAPYLDLDYFNVCRFYDWEGEGVIF